MSLWQLLWQVSSGLASALVTLLLYGISTIFLFVKCPIIYAHSCRYSGAGPIGLVSLLSARAAGAEPIVITDLFQSRLDFAKKLVPGVRTVLIKRGTTPKESAEEIKTAANGPVKVTLECTGVENSVHTAANVRIYIFPISRRSSLITNFLELGNTIRWAGVYHWCREE